MVETRLESTPGVGWIMGDELAAGPMLEPQPQPQPWPWPWPILAGMTTMMNNSSNSNSNSDRDSGGGVVFTLPLPAMASLTRSIWLALSLHSTAVAHPTLWHAGVWTLSDAWGGQRRELAAPVPHALQPPPRHRHATPLYSLGAGLLGIDFSARGLVLRPTLPLHLGAYHCCRSSREWGALRSSHPSARLLIGAPVIEIERLLLSCICSCTWKQRPIRRLQQ